MSSSPTTATPTPTQIPLITSTLQNNNAVFADFRSHTNGSRIETKSAVLNIIRKAYPEYHVTEVAQQSCSLFEFAKAGKAVCTFDAGDYGKGDESKTGDAGKDGMGMGIGLGREADVARTWVAVGSGVEKKMHPGTLVDEYRFARFHYIWQAKQFLLYHIAFQDPFQSPSRVFYILYPRSAPASPFSAPSPGHCSTTDALILACGKWTSLLHEEIWVFDNGHWEKSRSLWESIEGASWDDVILDPEMKKGLIEDVQGFFDSKEVYGKYAVPWKRGIILHGVPGNGKTVSIKALINALSARPDQISSLYIKSLETKGNTAQYSIRQIFSHARRSAPCLLIFEDLDSLVGDSIRSYFLNEVDGLESNDGILMIGSTNHLDRLDPAIAKRPSRFDRKYCFKLPGGRERALYAEYWRRKLVGREEGVVFPEELCGVVAGLTEGFSFAYLKELFVGALLCLVRGFKGDDFEIVDVEEAASAPSDDGDGEGKDADTLPAGHDAVEGKEDDEVCTCASKCSTCGKPVPSPPMVTTPPITDENPSKLSPDPTTHKPKSIPVVDIPDHLADNLLLKVIKHQIRVLHAEMDNTKTEEWPSGKRDVGIAAAESRAQRRMMRRGGV
ncbi:P-loop containing nucleoside triphosphate hydrolase protein [Byssothecium circinans]|uniref:P-loop containing nucleoside triphosphate hydrolase protein n=1 Tax=Byssothecium circinans TaxID=147558 RepID=A0A6A5TRW9_9PLEO|nr:P-loop containing nucleoside triphosphate hydrolase protein [Byssothecium circinans]